MFGLKSIFGAKHDDQARTLYIATVHAARNPHFFTAWGIPDTPEGRFEMLALHAILLLKRLVAVDGAQTLSQAYFDTMFADMDQNLRELGVGDMSVGKKIKKLSKGFYARLDVYTKALDTDAHEPLNEALHRYAFDEKTPSAETAVAAFNYARAQHKHLSYIDEQTLLKGDVTFIGPDA